MTHRVRSDIVSCSHYLHILPSYSNKTKATSCDRACHIVNVKFEKEFDMQEGEEVNVKTEKNILCGEEGGIGMKHDKAIYSAEEDEDVGVIEDMKQQLLQNHVLQPQRQLQEQQDRQQLLCAVRQLYQREQQVLQIWLQQILALKQMVQVLTPGAISD